MNYKKWLQEIVQPFGIDLTQWSVRLVSQTARPSHYPSHLPHSGTMLLADAPQEGLGIRIENVWVDGAGEIVQHDAIILET